MSIIVNFINTKVLPKILVFVNSKGIIAVKDGMLSILPLTVVGSFFLVIGQIPSKEINDFIANIFGNNWTEPFMQVYGGTFAIMGLMRGLNRYLLGYLLFRPFLLLLTLMLSRLFQVKLSIIRYLKLGLVGRE